MTESITAFASFTKTGKHDIALMGPDGKRLEPGDSRVKFTDTGSATFITVTTPEAGAWQAEIAANGEFSLSVYASLNAQGIADAPEVFEFEFVKLAGRPGHEGLFPIAGQPTDSNQTVLVNITDPGGAKILEVELKLLSLSGKTLSQTKLLVGDDIYSSRDDFVGAVKLPDEPFRVAVRATDNLGRVHQKLFKQMYQLTGVAIYSNISFEELIAGTTSVLSFLVQNNGSGGAFRVVIIAVPVGGSIALSGDTLGEPALITLAGGESRVMEKKLYVPANDPGITKYVVTATISDVNNEKNTSGISFDLYIARR